MHETPRNEEPSTMLQDRHGNCAILQGVSARGALSETLLSIEVEQRYLNPLDTNIEAVYTFPLPIGAVLLEMAVDIGGKTLVGQVVEKKAAERRYEDAITEGDSAIMLEETGNGLYTMNVGNLLAGETASIRYRYAMMLAWQGDSLRLLIPTTIAPRYGNAAAAGLKPWQIPESSFLIEYPFALNILVTGQLADCSIASSTHPISVSRCAAGLEISLAKPAMLDRDFVLSVRAADKTPGRVTLLKDGDQQLAFASLRLPEVKQASVAPLCLKVLIDCSGSMSGTSISQARKAALAMLDLLRPQDYFNVTLYGSRHQHLFPQLVPGGVAQIESARQRLLNLDADLGGTETGNALIAAYQLSGDTSSNFDRWFARWSADGAGEKDGESGSDEFTPRPAVLLITDGEIWDDEKIIAQARQSGHRVFTVGVGFSVAEGFVRKIARETGAACELVAPQEGMAEKILAQFHRLRQPRLAPISLNWDAAPTWQTALPETLFAGDTLNIFAGFDASPPKSLTLSNGETFAVPSLLPAQTILHDLPRLAAHARLPSISNAKEKLALALAYQLLTPQTNFLVVAQRDEKSADLPTLVKVDHMLAAGWGGAGSLAAPMALMESPAGCYSMPVESATEAAPADYSHLDTPCIVRKRTVTVEALANSGVDRYDIPAFLRNDAKAPERPAKTRSVQKDRLLPVDKLVQSQAISAQPPAAFIRMLKPSLVEFLQQKTLTDSVDQLVACGLPEAIARRLGEIQARHQADPVILAFLYTLANSALAEHFTRELRRRILNTWKKQPTQNAELLVLLSDALAGTQADIWQWQGADSLHDH